MSTIKLSTRILFCVLFGFTASLSIAQSHIESYCAYNGFELDNLEIPLTAVFQGGPAKEGVPSIEDPQFLSPANASFLQDHEPIIGVFVNGIAKAYPIKIMNYHEIINDQFGDEAVAITYSPLCASAMAFSAR